MYDMHLCTYEPEIAITSSLYPAMQAREELRRLKYIRDATWAVGIIRKWFYGWKARKQLREIKYKLRVEQSVVVIQAYYRGWKVFKYCFTLLLYTSVMTICRLLQVIKGVSIHEIFPCIAVQKICRGREVY